jgi:hypothetical protein
MVDSNVQNLNMVQTVLRSLMNTFGSQKELWESADGELFLVALTRIPSMYWIESSFDSWLLSRLFEQLFQTERNTPKVIASLNDMVRDLYKRDFVKFNGLLSDLLDIITSNRV